MNIKLMTVADLVAALLALPQDAPIKSSMNSKGMRNLRGIRFVFSPTDGVLYHYRGDIDDARIDGYLPRETLLFLGDSLEGVVDEDR